MTLKLNAVLTSGFLCAAAFAGTGGTAQAQTTIYNFEVITQNSGAASTTLYSGQGALGAGGTIFNTANPGGSTNFTSAAGEDSNGGQSGVTFSVSNSTFTYSDAPSSAYTATDPAQLFTQYDYVNGGTASFSLANLTADTPYTLYLYGSDNYGENTTFGVTGGTAVNPGGGTATSATTGGSRNLTAFNYGQDYVVFTGVTDANGDISGTAGPSGPFNGLQVELTSAAPEPSQWGTLVLVSLGLGALMLRARKRLAGVA